MAREHAEVCDKARPNLIRLTLLAISYSQSTLSTINLHASRDDWQICLEDDFTTRSFVASQDLNIQTVKLFKLLVNLLITSPRIYIRTFSILTLCVTKMSDIQYFNFYDTHSYFSVINFISENKILKILTKASYMDAKLSLNIIISSYKKCFSGIIIPCSLCCSFTKIYVLRWRLCSWMRHPTYLSLNTRHKRELSFP